MSRDPVTSSDWQEAADAALYCLLVQSARDYGLIEGGPDIAAGRCERILEEAAARGITPRDPFGEDSSCAD